jgi:acetylcholinesterase
MSRRTNAQTQAYLKANYLPTANASTIQQVSNAYPDDITQGSPFNTAILNAITPEFKRLAAFQGDISFQAPRRFFTGQQASKQKIFQFRKFMAHFEIALIDGK